MIVTNSTSIDLGFAQYVIGVGKSLDVSAVAAEWFLRHGCTEKGAKADPADAITEPTPRRRRNKKD